MKTRKSLIASPLLLAALVLAGCGGDKGGDGGIVIDFWHTFGDIPETALNEKAAEFKQIIKEHDGVDVEIRTSYQGAYKDMPQKVSNALGIGDQPTMVVAYADHVADYMDKEGNTPGKYVVNFDQFINDPEITFGTESYLNDTEDVDDIIQSYLEEGRQMKREGTYLLPYMKSTEIMTYNLSVAQAVVPLIFDGRDSDHPTVLAPQVEEFMRTITWNQLMEIADYIVDHKSSYPTVEYPVYYDSDSNLFITELYQRNIPYSSIDDQGVGNIDFATGEALTKAKAMVQELRDAHNDGLFTTKGAEGTYASNNFKEVKTIFTIGSSGGTGYSIPAGGSFDVAFAKVPAMTDDESRIKYISQGPSICFLNNPSISKEANDAKLKYAWKFVKFILSSDANAEITTIGSEGYSPVRESCYSTEAYLDFIGKANALSKAAVITQTDVAGNYFNSSVFVGSASLREQVGGIITNALTKETSIDTIFTNAISNANSNIR